MERMTTRKNVDIRTILALLFWLRKLERTELFRATYASTQLQSVHRTRCVPYVFRHLNTRAPKTHIDKNNKVRHSSPCTETRP